MSLINQMLKDLEKRRSRDLETSDSLRNNITWETKPESKRFNFYILAVVVIVLSLLTIIAYLFWERSAKQESFINVENKNTTSIKSQKPKYIQKQNKPKAIEPFVKKTPAKKTNIDGNRAYAEVIEAEPTIDTEKIENDKPQKIKKRHRPLNDEQLAELEYKKGYQSLQQGRMRQGKEHLREALSFYSSHLKAREMLSGLYIKSGRYVEAASLLREGIKIVPTYSLFAKLYARVLLEQNNPQLAIQVLERGAATTSEVELDYRALLAATYQRVKNHEKAISVYLQLVKVKPTVGIWWLGLAISLEKSGKNKEALEAYQRAQKAGNLKAGLVKFTNNRVSALKEIGFPKSN